MIKSNLKVFDNGLPMQDLGIFWNQLCTEDKLLFISIEHNMRIKDLLINRRIKNNYIVEAAKSSLSSEVIESNLSWTKNEYLFFCHLVTTKSLEGSLGDITLPLEHKLNIDLNYSQSTALAIKEEMRLSNRLVIQYQAGRSSISLFEYIVKVLINFKVIRDDSLFDHLTVDSEVELPMEYIQQERELFIKIFNHMFKYN